MTGGRLIGNFNGCMYLEDINNTFGPTTPNKDTF